MARMSEERIERFRSRKPELLTFPEYVEILDEIERAQASEDDLQAQLDELEE